MKQKKALLLVALLSIIGLTLRVWRLEELFHFTYDEEVFAFVGKRMWVNGHIPLIGGVTPMHFHLGPYFYWFSGLVLGLFQLNPLGWGYVAGLISMITGLLLFYTGSKMYSNRIGLLAFFLSTFSFSQNVFDRHYWGLSFNGLWSLLTVLSLYQLLKGKRRYSWVLAIVVFFAFHFDPSTLVLYLVIGLILLIHVLKPQIMSFPKSINYSKVILILGGVFFISLIPLIVFDVRHDFANSKGFGLYFEELNSKKTSSEKSQFSDTLLFIPRVLSRAIVITAPTELSTQYSYCTQYAQGKLKDVPITLTLVTTALFISGALIGWSNRNRQATLLLLLAFATAGLGIVIYGVVFKGQLYDHYITTLLPPFYLLVAIVVDRFNMKKWFVIIALTLFAIINITSLYNARHQFGFSDKMRAVHWAIDITGDKPFSLDVIGECFRYNGYRYLFYLAGKEPVKSYVDANFTHLFDQPPSLEHPELLVVIVNKDQHELDEFQKEYEHFKRKQITSTFFNEIEVLLVDNSGDEFRGKY